MPYQAPVKIKADGISGFSQEDIDDLYKFIRINVKGIDAKLENFRNSRLPELVRLYKGIPKDKEADFPWPGAANLVIQLIGTFVDELLSRIMGAKYMYDPLWVIQLLGENPEGNAEDMKRILETFLMDEAYDPYALDYYRVDQAFNNSAIKYGTGIMEFPWEYDVEKEYVYVGGGLAEKPKIEYTFKDSVKRDSPHPKLVPLNKFGIDPRVPVLGDAEFYYTIETLSFWQVTDLKAKNSLYNEEDVAKILGTPDRLEPDQMQREVNEATGTQGESTEHSGAEWDIYNCYIKYRKGSSVYNILAKYHKKSDTVAYAIFNFYPANIHPVEDAKLGYDDENYFGAGYAQMLRSYQKELSQNSNWRTNNRNFAMLGIFRVDPDSKLSSILQMYPGVMIPAKDGAIEQLKQPQDVGYSSEADQFIMSAAQQRAGIDPAIGGTGGGIVNNKRGIYSASGTSMMLIQQNNRNNLRMSDMRSAHVRIAIKLMQMYANIGIGDKLKKYGERAETLKKAFAAYKAGTIGFRLRPTTASNNKELERQNDILLQGALSRFVQENAQIIQALSANPGQIPPALKEFYTDALLGNAALFKDILRNFNRDDTTRLMPDMVSVVQKLQPPEAGNGNAAGSGAGPQAGPDQGAIPNGGVQGSGAIPS